MGIIFQLAVNGIVSGALFALLAGSFAIIYQTTKVFHLAHGAVITAGAYFTLLFFSLSFLPKPLAVLLAIGLAALTGMLCEMLVYRPIRKRAASPLVFLIAALGLYTLLQNTISICFGDDSRSLNTLAPSRGYAIGGAYITGIQLITTAAALLLVCLLQVFLRYTSRGRAIRAVAADPELATIYGISARNIFLWAFAVGSAMAAAAGILSAADTNMTPVFGFNLMLSGVVAMVIGGGQVRGVIAGAFCVALLQQLTAWYIDNKWMAASTYLLLIILLIFRPLGISGQTSKKNTI